MDILFLNIITSIPDIISDSVKDNPNVAYLVICFAMFLENIIPPIPSEIIMPLGGFFVYQGDLNFYILIKIDAIESNSSKIKVQFVGNFSSMIEMMIKKPLNAFIDSLKNKIENISF